MNARMLAGAALLALLTTAPALAQTSAAPAPSAQDAQKLQRIAQDADKIAGTPMDQEQRLSLIDDIDQAWNGVEDVYRRLDVPANLAGTQHEDDFTVMDTRLSLLNSSNFYFDAGAQQSARDVADWARHLLEATKPA